MPAFTVWGKVRSHLMGLSVEIPIRVASAFPRKSWLTSLRQLAANLPPSAYLIVKPTFAPALQLSPEKRILPSLMYTGWMKFCVRYACIQLSDAPAETESQSLTLYAKLGFTSIVVRSELRA